MKNPKLIRRLMLAVALVALIATVGVFVGYRRMTHNPEAILDLVQTGADMQLSKIRQTASKNGIKEWRLEAESATLIKEKNIMRLAKPDVEFFMENGDNLHLTADEGTIHTDSSRLNVSGRVSAANSLYRFQTEDLDYDPKARTLNADKPVHISGQSFTLRADSMAMNIATRITRFEGGVKGVISDDFQL